MTRNPSLIRSSEIGTEIGTAVRVRIPLLVVISREPLAAELLGTDDRARLAGLTPQRAADFLASRRAARLARSITGAGTANRGTRPGSHVSSAHSGGVGVCATVLPPAPAELVGLGVDIEPARAASARAARFYLRGPELDWLTSSATSAEHRSEQQVRLWTTKEALFKADPGNRTTILQSYLLLDPGSELGAARRIAAGTGGDAPAFGYIHARLAELHLSTAVALRTSPQLTGTARQRWQGRNVSGPTITFDAVAERISAVLSIPRDRLTPQSTLADLAADSFLLVEMVVDLQEEFDSVFTQAELRQVTELGDLVGLLQRHAGGGATAAVDGQFGR